MSFTSVLSKIEQVIVAGAKDASVIYPFLAPLVGLMPSIGPKSVSVITTGVRDLQMLANISQDVQAMMAAAGAQVTGSQKAAAMAPKISVLFHDIETLGGEPLGKIIQDQTEWNAAMQDMAMGVGRALKACGK